jgi:hypothetical protein
MLWGRFTYLLRYTIWAVTSTSSSMLRLKGSFTLYCAKDPPFLNRDHPYINVDAPGEGERVLVLSTLDKEYPCDLGVIIQGHEVTEMRDVILIGMDGQPDHLSRIGTGQVHRPLDAGQLDVLKFVAEGQADGQQQQDDYLTTYHYLIISPFFIKVR